MLTRFQALVSRETHAEVYPTFGTYEGVPSIVIQIGASVAIDPEKIKIATGKYGTVEAWYHLCDLEPALALLSLIEDGTYRQDTHSWHGDRVSWVQGPLPGERINYEPSDRIQCGICDRWMSHEEFINHSHGMDK